jgi:hypothetical protein
MHAVLSHENVSGPQLWLFAARRNYDQLGCKSAMPLRWATSPIARRAGSNTSVESPLSLTRMLVRIVLRPSPARRSRGKLSTVLTYQLHGRLSGVAC